jgi:predicted dehydrogenase
MPEADIVAACDQDVERARAAAPSAYTSVEEMLSREKLDFLDIATRPDSHLPLVRLAASYGVPVICQKPMAPNWDDAVAMVEAAEEAGVPLMIHENWRWQPWHREARRRIEQGEIGEPVAYSFQIRQRDGLVERPYPNQPYFAEMPRLLIYEMMVHQIDTSRFLFGDVEAVTARARRVNPVIKGEDQATVILTHEDGLQGVIDGNRFSNPSPPGPAMGVARLEGREGVIIITSQGEILVNDRKEWDPPEAIGYKGDSVLATQVHFIRGLISDEPMESAGREYLKTFAVIEAAYESVASGSVVRVKR